MASFGESLKQARKARNITLQEIAETTKIGTRTLQALEDERFELLPGGIFNKGFVRSYARCVGLDEEKTVAAYVAAAKVAPEMDMQTLSTQMVAARPKQKEPAVSAVTLVGIVAVLVALGLGALWFREHRKEAKEQAAVQQTAPAPTVNAAPMTTIPADNAAQNAVTTPSANAIGGANSSTTSGPVPAPTMAAPTAPVAPADHASAATKAGAAQGNPQGSSEGAGAPVEVLISATAKSWISVKSDGKTVESLTLDPEKPELSTRSYKAHEKLKLVVGNPAGVMVTYNGKQEGALGAEGQRAVVTFTPEGMEKQ